MPRNNRLPTPRHHKASNRTVITLGGRDFYCGPHGTPEALQLAEQLLGQWLAAGRPVGGPPDPNRPAPVELLITPPAVAGSVLSIDRLVLKYLDYADTYYRNPDGQPTREPESMKLAFRPLIELFSGTKAEAFGPKSLKAVRDRMIQNDISRREVNKRIGYIQRMFRWACQEELLPAHHYHGLKSLQALKAHRSAARETLPVTPADDRDIEKILPLLPPILQAMVMIQRWTGMRTGELVIMQPGNITMGDKAWEYRPSHHKTKHHGHERVVPLGPRVQTLLKPYLTNCGPTDYIFTPALAVQERNQLKRQHRKTRVQPSQISRAKKNRKKPLTERYDSRTYYRALWYAQERAIKDGVRFTRCSPSIPQSLASLVRS